MINTSAFLGQLRDPFAGWRSGCKRQASLVLKRAEGASAADCRAM